MNAQNYLKFHYETEIIPNLINKFLCIIDASALSNVILYKFAGGLVQISAPHPLTPDPFSPLLEERGQGRGGVIKFRE